MTKLRPRERYTLFQQGHRLLFAFVCLAFSLCAQVARAEFDEDQLIAEAQVAEAHLLTEDTPSYSRAFDEIIEGFHERRGLTVKSVEFLWHLLSLTRVESVNDAGNIAFRSTQALKAIYANGPVEIRKEIEGRVATSFARVVSINRLSNEYADNLADLAVMVYVPGANRKLSHALAQLFIKGKDLTIAFRSSQSLNINNLKLGERSYRDLMREKDPELYVAHDDYDLYTGLDFEILRWRYDSESSVMSLYLINRDLMRAIHHRSDATRERGLSAVIWFLNEKKFGVIDIELIKLVEQMSTPKPQIQELREQIIKMLADPDFSFRPINFKTEIRNDSLQNFRTLIADFTAKKTPLYLKTLQLDMMFSLLNMAIQTYPDPETLEMAYGLLEEVRLRQVLLVDSDGKDVSPYRADYIRNIHALEKSAVENRAPVIALQAQLLIEETKPKTCAKILSFAERKAQANSVRSNR